MIGSLIHSFLWFSTPTLITILLFILGHTWRFRFHGWEQVLKYDSSVSYAFWHENMLPVLFSHRGRGVGIIVSQSPDGEIISRVLKILGFKVFRGDSEVGGRKAMLGLIKYGKKGNEIAITPDGPKGPRREVKKGVFVIVRRANLPLFAAKIEADRCFRFSSWDKLMLPLPFSRIDIFIRGPIEQLNEEVLEKALSD
ncbi:lysophospholipid acyltransferase family protein [candidate division WOR-3 bacterium]|nr:lysophospholipid acyltransferase family protein [candidate division WOR-3 bacterium]MCK4528479.1 lysophospholipid acyltransferase family protein [candidate division WOR-3 bacterium]